MLLDIRNLKTYYTINKGVVRALDGVSFKLQKGENLGLVGESGCGKTTAAKSINRILPPNGKIVGGQVVFKDRDLVPLPDKSLNKVRWQEIAMVTQSAMNALDPVYKIGDQIIEGITAHENISKKEAWRRSEELFAMVGLEKKRLHDFPHQLSGGQKQRVVIAMALSLKPDLIIADEPTTALDVVVQDGILSQFIKLQEQIQSSIILVTHDISVVAEICQRVAVMYAGKIVEQGTRHQIFKEPCHPYTMGLLNAFPTLAAAQGRLISIPGSPPDLSQEYDGCLFAPRCPFATDRCYEEQPVDKTIEPGHSVLCHYVENALSFRQQAQAETTWHTNSPDPHHSRQPGDKKVLELKGLKKWFPLRKSVMGRGRDLFLRAVDGVDLAVCEREILGLAGESGSGKSTMGELIARLQLPTDGYILYSGQPTRTMTAREIKVFRRNFQMVFQDPYETLNPRFTVLNTVMEPLKIHGIGATYEEKLALTKKALERAGLLPAESFMDRFPHQLSGGQRQRVALARAIVLEPKFIIADEPVSMLDVSIRAGILNLLRNMRDELEASLIYISHDLATIRYICDRTVILYLGRPAEIGPTEDVITNPAHPYTKMLLAAVPIPDPDTGRKRVDPRGEIPDPIKLPNGCRFHPRCTEAKARCGWEGRDLDHLLTKLKEMEQLPRKDRRFIEAITKTHIDGLNILITWTGDKVSSEEMYEFLQRVVKEDSPYLLAGCTDMEKKKDSLYLTFPPQPEPEETVLKDGHSVYCHLYQK